ncbi:MAG: hypothetical protein ACRC9L_05890 [Brevinema sp.]
MINIAICDDDNAVCTQIESILLEYAKQVALPVEISVFYCGESFLDFLGRGKSFDLIFLDIELGAINGVKASTKNAKGIF